MRQPLTPGVAYKRLRRSQHVINVLVKHGFGDILSRIRVWECVHFERGLLKRECKFPELNEPQRLRMALEEMGPTFIKLGQMLSTRPDLIPREFIVELKKLQSAAHFIPSETIRGIIEIELGKPISEVFDSFEDKPLAAASLAQVHRAVLKGEQVVLKVQRPNIAEDIQLDADIMRGIAELAERHSPRLYPANPVGMVDELAEQIMKEIDFRQEANNMTHYARLFAGDPTIHIPKLYAELSTKRVITMEYLEGINISDTKRLIDEGYDRPLIAKRGAIIEFKAIFEHGFFHADPHPGNILIMKDNVIGLIDFGLMAGLTLRDRERLAKLVYFIAIRDERRVARALNELMQSEESISAEDLEPAMSDIMKQYADVPTRDLHLAAMLYAMLKSIIAHHGRFRPELIWITKSIATQEDVARSLEADFNLADLGKPYAQKLLTRRLNPLTEAKEFTYWVADALDVVREIPYDLGVIFRQAKKGKFKIEFEHVGLEAMRKTISRATNRLSLTILIAALLISSSMVVIAGVRGPVVGSIPLLAFIGYIFAVFFSMLLAISVWFHSD